MRKTTQTKFNTYVIKVQSNQCDQNDYPIACILLSFIYKTYNILFLCEALYFSTQIYKIVNSIN